MGSALPFPGIELGSAHCANARHHHWEMIGQTSGHNCCCSDSFHRGTAEVRSNHSERQVRVKATGDHHARNAFRGWNNDGKPVGASQFVQLLNRCLLVGCMESGDAHASAQMCDRSSPAIASATLAIADAPDPATGWGSCTRGISGIPAARAMKSPWLQNSVVTRAIAGRLVRAIAIPSRTVPEVQLPQCPYAVTIA